MICELKISDDIFDVEPEYVYFQGKSCDDVNSIW